MGQKGCSGSALEGRGTDDVSYLPSADLGASLAATAGSGRLQVCAYVRCHGLVWWWWGALCEILRTPSDLGRDRAHMSLTHGYRPA